MKRIGLLAVLVLCLSIAVTASGMIVIKDLKFEGSGDLIRLDSNGNPVYSGWTPGPVSGQNGWKGTGSIDACCCGNGVYADAYGVKEVTGYGDSWWQDWMCFWVTNGFPHANVYTPGAGVGYFEYDVCISQDMIDELAGSGDCSYTRSSWSHECFEYDIANGYTRPILGGNFEQRVWLRADGNVKFRIKSSYQGPYLNGLYGETVYAYGSWAASPGCYRVSIKLDGTAGPTVGTLSIDGSPVATLNLKGPIYAPFFIWRQITQLMGGSTNYKPCYDNILVYQVPEPATLLLLGGGLLFGGLAYHRRR